MSALAGIRRLRFVAVVVMIAGAWNLPTPARAEDPAEAAIAQAEALMAAGNKARAIELLNATLREVEGRLGPDVPMMGAVQNTLGRALADSGQFEKSVPHFRNALAIGRAHPGETGNLRLSSLNNLAAVLLKSANFAEALPLCEESVRGVEAELGPDDPRTTITRNTLAQAYLAAKRPADAIPVARRALQSAESRSKPDDPETIYSRNTLSVALLQTSNFDEAERLFNASLAIAKAKLKPDDERFKATLNGLVSVYQLTGRIAEARAITKDLEGEPIRAGVRGSDEGIRLNNLAQIAQMAGDFDKAKELYDRALEATLKDFASDHPQVGAIYANMSGMYSLQSKFTEAENYARKALAIAEKNPGRATVAEAKACATLALVHQRAGRPADAAPLLERAYATLLDQLGPGHPDTAYVLANLSGVDWAMGNLEGSVKRGRAALADVEKRLPGENRHTAVILLNLGQALVQLRRFEEAEPYLRRAVAIMEKEPGRPSADAAAAHNALAGLYQLTGRPKEAEAAFRKVVAILVDWFGPDHPDTAKAIDNLGSTLAAAGRWTEAADEFDRSRRSRRSFLDRTLPRMAEEDQIRLMDDGERVSRDAALSMALGRQSVPGLPARSAEWALNSKAITVSALAERAILSRDDGKPEVVRLVGERDTVRGRLATLTVPRGRTEAEAAPAEEIATLVDRERELSRQLGLALGRPDVGDGWVALDKVRKALPADAVLVEFARVRVLDVAAVAGGLGWRPPRYAAWVIPATGRGEVTLVDLGDAGEIETAISDVLRGLSKEVMGSARPGIEKESEARIVGPLRTLADRVIEPLRPHLGGARRWVLSPDAALWLVPWAALPDKAGRYAIEDNLIHLVVTGRDLLTHPSDATSEAPAILADPDYGRDRNVVVATARERGRVRGAAHPPTTGSGSPRRDLLPDNFERLGGSADEAWAVAPFLKAITGTEPGVYLDAAASETVFKSLRGPKVLILSTHGFFLGEPEPTAKGPVAPANPLLLCGLILAGYNKDARAITGADASGTDDGVLSGLEVAASDLRGTELVVLSACETGLGEIRIGEGVAGLRQVFQLAGARAVVASLWSVRDVESYQLMAAFFQGLSHRRGYASALRDAQLALIADRRNRLGAAHPYYWAAFTLTGAPGESWRHEPLDGDLPSIPPPGTTIEIDGNYGPLSPVTGRPTPGGPRSDAVLGGILLVVGGSLAGWWWRRGVATPA